jgi:endonuclease YncB( thermonuclease family)
VLLAAAVLAATSTFAAEMLQGRVVKVADGDTITVLDATNMQHRIRLDKIDAPEKSQPFGDSSRKHLAALVAGKIVEVEWTKKDKYGRILGTVWAMLPVRTDVNLQMVEDGFAWHYKHFDNTPSYAAAETSARKAKRGLWKDPAPIPPHIFRNTGKRFHASREMGNTTYFYNANDSPAGSATRTGW